MLPAPSPALFPRAGTLRPLASVALRIADAPLRQGLPQLLAAALLCAPLASVGPAHAEVVSPDQRISPIADVENEPDIAASGSTVVALWFKAVAGDEAAWAYSVNGGTTWLDGGSLPRIPYQVVPNGHPSICVDGQGIFYAAADLSTSTGCGIGVWNGRLQGQSFVWLGPVSAVPQLGSNIEPHEFPRIVCDPDRGYLYLTYTFNVPENGYEATPYVVRSLNGGQTWSAPQYMTTSSTTGPVRAAVGPYGELYVVWIEYATGQVLGRRSLDFGVTFGPVFTVGPIVDNLGMAPPAWTSSPDRGGNSLYPALYTAAPNIPAIVVDRSLGPHRGRLYVTWTDYATGAAGPSTGSVTDVEPNDFISAATPVAIGQDIVHHVPNGHTGASNCGWFTFNASQGTTLWLSGEVTNVYPSQYPFSEPVLLYCGADSAHLVPMAEHDIPVAGTYQIPPLIYTIPKTERYWFPLNCASAWSYDEVVHLRSYTPSAGQMARDSRDVVLTISDDGGQSWSPKRLVNDSPPGFDDCFPDVAVDDLGQVHVVWYDRRDDPDCGTRVATYWTASLNGGASFLPSRRLSRDISSWQCGGQGPNIGDHLSVKTAGTRVYAVWTKIACPDSVDVYEAQINADDPTAIAVSGPEAELQGSRVRVNWEVSDPSRLSSFSIWRAEGASQGYSLLTPAPIPAAGTGAYAATDSLTRPGTSYSYKLEVTWADGSTSWLGPVSVSVPALTGRTTWAASGPNPFSQSISLTLATPQAG